MATQAQHAVPKGGQKAPKAGTRAAQLAAQHAAAQHAAQQEELIKQYIAKIHYSDRYADDNFEYRHVILPKQLFKMLPKEYFKTDDSGTLVLLTDEQWRGIGIQQSLGWEHYEVHTPEPHVLLFRRPCEPIEPKPPTKFGWK